jgi:glycosidase
MRQSKPVVYQIFTRVFGNKVSSGLPWGGMRTNGVGKFSDISDIALREIKSLGVTHVWYTGVLHHAMTEDYAEFGISADHPSIVKGLAGSPYAIKDYYQVNPDLACNPNQRMTEFEALIERTHLAGLKVIIDIVPNHVARHYQGKNNPKLVEDFGANDNTSVAYHRDNNFYYIPNRSFELPDISAAFKPPHSHRSDSDISYIEFPAKWTGNGARLTKPSENDWYETVKINYGVRPDGRHDFESLPEGYNKQDVQTHLAFWQQHSLPDSWLKFRDIVLFWLDKGVDGFRYDVAELVPVEFWSFLNSTIKSLKPDTFLLAEVYQPHLYRDYIHLGKMDYLYDKVDLYDTLRAIMRGEESSRKLPSIVDSLSDIDEYMLRFLENHDEQRIASPEFAGDSDKARPAMLLCATIGQSATMIYFGQEVGEPADFDAGFGKHSRTSIFDYSCAPHHQRWMNKGKFDGAALSAKEKDLRLFYQTLLNQTLSMPALRGEYINICCSVENQLGPMKDSVYLYARKLDQSLSLIAVNFSSQLRHQQRLEIHSEIIEALGLEDGCHTFIDRLGTEQTVNLVVQNQSATIDIDWLPLAAYLFERVD